MPILYNNYQGLRVTTVAFGGGDIAIVSMKDEENDNAHLVGLWETPEPGEVGECAHGEVAVNMAGPYVLLKFTSPASIDALIGQLQTVKAEMENLQDKENEA